MKPEKEVIETHSAKHDIRFKRVVFIESDVGYL